MSDIGENTRHAAAAGLPGRKCCLTYFSSEVLVARGGQEEVPALTPPIAVRPVHDVQEPVRVVVVLVPYAPNVFASSQIVKFHLQMDGGVAGVRPGDYRVERTKYTFFRLEEMTYLSIAPSASAD